MDFCSLEVRETFRFFFGIFSTFKTIYLDNSCVNSILSSINLINYKVWELNQSHLTIHSLFVLQ